MSFSFDYSGGFTDLVRARFALGDTDADAVIFDDELLNALITEHGDWRAAVRVALNNMIAVLSRTPNFTADWLKVDVSTAINQFRLNLASFEAEYGDAFSVEATAVHTYRADSGATGVSYGE